jgi:hypothetical protein
MAPRRRRQKTPPPAPSSLESEPSSSSSDSESNYRPAFVVDLDGSSDNDSGPGAVSSSSESEEEEAPTPAQAPPGKLKPHHDPGARIQCIHMLTAGIPHYHITALTHVSKSQIYKIYDKAIERGYNPKVSKIVLLKYVVDAPKPGRPKTSPVVVDHILRILTKNSTTRSYSAARLAYEVSSIPGIATISASTVYRVLKTEGYSVCKQTVKPGLTMDMKKARLAWCLLHEHWTLEDWKNVIFTDETSVQMGGVRGKRRVWRKADEAYHPHVIKRRWKGFKEFMFWGAFSYDKKGPCHIWKNETAAEKKARVADLDERNAKREAADRKKWEDEVEEKRRGVKKPGRRPTWKHTEERGAFVVKKGRGGINWYRYQKVILEALLIPFAKECQEDRPDTIIQEDGAPAHTSHYQQEVFKLADIVKLLWPGNSPDLNAIEPTWNWMKRETTKKGGPTGKKQMKIDWIKCWDEMPQSKIQDWIERIVVHIQEVILLDGGNEYKEGRCKGQLKKTVH